MGVEISNFRFMLPLTQSEGKRILLSSAQFAFTINRFHKLYPSFKFLLHTLFSLDQYARPRVKFQQIGNIQFVDEELLLWEEVKRLIRSSPFDGKEKWIEFKRIGNYFEYYSSRGTIFFWWYIWKIGNIVLRRISSSWETNNGNIHVGAENSVCPNRYVKKTYACRHPQMNSKKKSKNNNVAYMSAGGEKKLLLKNLVSD